MMLASRFLQVLAVLTLPATVLAAVAGSYSPPQTKPEEGPTYGNITYITKKPTATFEYICPRAGSQNWMGVWHAYGGGPDNQTVDEKALKFEYAPESKGSVFFDATKFDPGAYKVYFLEDDGYKWLADPITFSVGPKEIKWYVRKTTSRPARRGQMFEYNICNLVNNAGDPGNKFSLVSSNNGGWARLTLAGLVRGIPGNTAKDTKMEVQVTTSKNLIYFSDVHIPVRPVDGPLVESLKVMTFNMMDGGTEFNNYHKKQLKFIIEQNADIVGLQKTQGHHANRLAFALGWWSIQTHDSAIISKFPLEEIKATNASVAARVKIDGDKQNIIFWNAHLSGQYYGPHAFCFCDKSAEDVKKQEESERAAAVKELAEAMKPYLDDSDKAPVFLTADLNSPSHQDWVKSTKDSHCGKESFEWPSTKLIDEAGLKDSFREAHPDPSNDTGVTWSPIVVDNNGKPEPKDRIDYIFYKGKVSVTASEVAVAGKPKAQPKQKDNDWTSDHSAVVSVFKMV